MGAWLQEVQSLRGAFLLDAGFCFALELWFRGVGPQDVRKRNEGQFCRVALWGVHHMPGSVTEKVLTG